MEAVLYTKDRDQRVTCTACLRRCRLGPGQPGFCGIRVNSGGKLDLLTYSMPYSIQIDPIEKKPVLHMLPGTRILSLGTTGCNYACQYCQNYSMSQRKDVQGTRIEPREIVKLAIELGCSGIAYTYNEPTVFMEFAHDVGMLAKEKGLINIFVSNGYETPEAIEYASTFLDSMTIDFKGNAGNAFYRKYISVPSADPIFDTIEKAITEGIHVEVTDLVVPEVGDSLEDARSMIRKIKAKAGTSVPLSFLRFHPDYKMMNLPSTPLNTLEMHYALAKEEGMQFVYLGNIPGHVNESTYCPVCGSMLIYRNGFSSDVRGLDKNGNCKKCGFSSGIVLRYKPNKAGSLSTSILTR
ncbi:MAG: AmmeMemoRadiSam system radical SAM enzyme [Candidatus Thermoplasmatota archaeon]|nr:AmmeMemoRadiSam system radical SAM enzyme [Candidatus Thermoplasmatota archaeon]